MSRSSEAKILFSSPYEEGAMRALRFYLPSYLGFSSEVIAESIVQRRHVVSGLLRRANMGRWATEAMYIGKVAHDLMVAFRVSSRLRSVEVCVGMWGASSQTFAKLPPGCLKVLNFVNAHPTHHNERLLIAGAKSGDQEMVPHWFASRVDREIKLADLIVVPSHLVARDLSSRGVDPAKLHVQPYGVDARMFRRESIAAPRRRAGVITKDAPLRLLYVGQISKRKGLAELVSAVTVLKGLARLKVVGPIVDSGLARQALDANVELVPTVSREELVKLYQECDVFVLPSWEDTFGLVALEAMACGAVPLLSTSSGASELVLDPQLSFAAGDVDGLVAAIHYIADRPEDRNRWSKEAAEIARVHSWECFAGGVAGQMQSRSVVMDQAL